MARGDLTDGQWAVLEPLLPKGRRLGRPPTWTRRQLIDGIRFRARTGIPWRDAPVEGSCKTMSIVVTAGQRDDSPQFEAVPEGIRVPRSGQGRPRTRPRRVRADKAWASRRNRACLPLRAGWTQ
ncbi:transposase [Streptomyces scopuliridis]|uniref:Transposase n=1 Tax=Streptomyces scopuliridis TaxID=452529 RepID=A0ACD4ZCJ1_9ACTN|nr:transposase [Streptomyces scopuliridis]WSB95869.1 transposase [Streptomyces scopuliridis]WSC10424.1 transposase [Streptomyces scopuliridis]